MNITSSTAVHRKRIKVSALPKFESDAVGMQNTDCNTNAVKRQSIHAGLEELQLCNGPALRLQDDETPPSQYSRTYIVSS